MTVIIDPAFYILQPIKLEIGNTENITVFSKNIYQIEKFSNKLKNYTSINTIVCNYNNIGSNNRFNQYQVLPENTHILNAFYKDDVYDTWQYFLKEVLNPDKAITTFFLNIKKNPFIVSTYLDKHSICASKYIVKIQNNKLHIIDKINNKYIYDINQLISGDININDLDKFFHNSFKIDLFHYLLKNKKSNMLNKLFISNNFIDIND